MENFTWWNKKSTSFFPLKVRYLYPFASVRRIYKHVPQQCIWELRMCKIVQISFSVRSQISRNSSLQWVCVNNGVNTKKTHFQNVNGVFLSKGNSPAFLQLPFPLAIPLIRYSSDPYNPVRNICRDTEKIIFFRSVGHCLIHPDVSIFFLGLWRVWGLCASDWNCHCKRETSEVSLVEGHESSAAL